MALIQVTPETLRGKAADVRTYRTEHDEAMGKLKNLVLALNEVWKGDAQDTFVAKFEAMQNTFNEFSALIENYAKAMETSANELEQTDINLQRSINNTFN